MQHTAAYLQAAEHWPQNKKLFQLHPFTLLPFKI